MESKKITNSVELPTLSYLKEMEERILKKIEDIHFSLKPTTNHPKWVKSSQVRKILGDISPNKLKEMRNRGQIPHKKIDGIYFYSIEAITKALTA